jgi:heme exporter protein A
VSAALLSFDKVSLIRGGRLLFENLDLIIGTGEGVQVTGPNGSGKSSLLRLAAGLLEPSAGRVGREEVALSDDRLALDPEVPLLSALRFWSRARDGGSSPEAALDRFGLAHLADVPVRLLSTGQAKRASLARVALSAARIWLLDEPANGLDRSGAAFLASAIAAHRGSGGAVLAASHVGLDGQWRPLELGG